MRTATRQDLLALRKELAGAAPTRRDVRKGSRGRNKARVVIPPAHSSAAYRLPADFPYEATPAEVEAHIDAAVVAHYPMAQQVAVARYLSDPDLYALILPPGMAVAVGELRARLSRRVHDLYLTVPKKDPMVTRLRQRDRWEGPCSPVVTKRADGTYWVGGERVSPQKAAGLLRARRDREPTTIEYR